MTTQAFLNGGSGGAHFIAHLPDLTAKMTSASEQLQEIPSHIDGFKRDSLIAGGAIATLLNCPITVVDSEISNNYAGEKVRDIPFSAIGGAIVALNGPISLTRTSIQENRVKNVGTIWNGGNSNISDSKILCNIGSGIFNKGTVTVLQSCLSSNISRRFGGGIHNNGDLTLVESSIIKNKAKDGGGIYSQGPFISERTKVKQNDPNNIVIV